MPAGPTLSWASAIGASPDGAARKRAIVAVGRSILVIIWALLSDTEAQFVDLGPDYYANRTNPERRVRHHIRELQALGYAVTLNPAA